MKQKQIKAIELSMKGYSVEEIASALMLIFSIHYKSAKSIALDGAWYASPQGNE